VAVASCLGPTEVTLVLTTDVPCDTLQMQRTSITVGTASDIEAKDPVTITDLCDPGAGTSHSIGTFVVIPGGGSSDEFAVRVVSGVDVPVGDCKGQGYHGCIVERRELAFVPHTPLTLPIPMDIDCLNVRCGTHETCFKGGCVSAHIANSSACASPGGCGPDVLPDGGARAADGSPETSQASAPDGAADATVPSDAGGGTEGASPSDASSPDGASVLGKCVAAASSSGVACAGGACTGGQVCCIASPLGGGPTTETCGPPAACDPDAGGSVGYSSFACRNVGDCPASTVCCIRAANSGYYTSCVPASSCVLGLNQRPTCRNACECGTLNCLPTTCGGAIGVCTATLATCL
jgi:hypothetical protein